MTALPNGVSYKKVGEMVFVSQRGYFAPPYVSCMFASLCSVLEWMGLSLPLPRLETDTPPDNFVWELHKASGASLTEGTTIHDTQVALQKLLPDVPVKFATGKPDDVINLLNNGAAVRVAVRCDKLPRAQRRFVGFGYTGKHAVAIMSTRRRDGVQEVLWFDPMGRPVTTWQGEWVKWADVLPAFQAANGRVTVTFGYRGEAIPVQPPVEKPPVVVPPEGPNIGDGNGDTEMVFSNVVERSRGTVGASTPVLHPVSLVQVMTVGPTTVKLFGETPDKKYRGVLVNSRQIEGANPKIALVAYDAVTDVHVEQDPVVDTSELEAVKASLAECEAKATADVADAESIVERHG